MDDAIMRFIWMTPGQSRSVGYDHCSHALIMRDILSLDRDDAPYQQIDGAVRSGNISTDSFLHATLIYQESYVRAHPDSFLAASYLNDIKSELNIEQVKSYLSAIKPANAKYPVIKKIEQFVANYKYKSTPKNGDAFYESILQKPDGSPFDSRAISGKAILLFFWYSGCGPCHKAIPGLKELYQKYKSSGLEILSFSLDSKQENWKKDIQKFDPPGINVSDLIGFNSPFFFHYAVSAFPTFIIFDTEKKIRLITSGNDEIGLLDASLNVLLNGK